MLTSATRSIGLNSPFRATMVNRIRYHGLIGVSPFSGAHEQWQRNKYEWLPFTWTTLQQNGITR
jgi:hypothetical protein